MVYYKWYTISLRTVKVLGTDLSGWKFRRQNWQLTLKLSVWKPLNFQVWSHKFYVWKSVSKLETEFETESRLDRDVMRPFPNLARLEALQNRRRFKHRAINCNFKLKISMYEMPLVSKRRCEQPDSCRLLATNRGDWKDRKDSLVKTLFTRGSLLNFLTRLIV